MLRTVITLVALGLVSAFTFRQTAQPVREFRLSSISSAAEKRVIRVSRSINSTLVLSNSDFKGYSGCNKFSGTYQIKNDTISFSLNPRTRTFCPDERFDIEKHLFKYLLAGKAAFELKGDTFLLTDTGGNVYRYLRQRDQER